MSNPTDAIPILLASAREDDYYNLRELLAQTCWILNKVDDWASALQVLRHIAIPIIICDADLPGLRWRQGLRIGEGMTTKPCVLLLSDVADAYLWNAFIECGGFDLLPRPLLQKQTLALLDFAYMHWKTGWPGERASLKR